jgi:hypothetical protein
MHTFAALRRERPSLVFAQNPSMILAFLVCLYSVMSGVPVIVDRHTTFLLSRKYRNTPRILLFKLLHRLTIKMATLTIVTNQFLADIVDDLGGRSFVLPDKLPDLTPTAKLSLKGEKKVLLISSCAKDEPIAEVLEAMRQLGEDRGTLYITGNSNKLERAIVDHAPENVIFTGFLPEQEFINHLFSVDCIMALTTSEYCMLCGCYEAVAAEKPLITSNKMVLRAYFSKAIFVETEAKAIAEGINLTFGNLETIQQEIASLKKLLSLEWEKNYEELERRLERLGKVS